MDLWIITQKGLCQKLRNIREQKWLYFKIQDQNETKLDCFDLDCSLAQKCMFSNNNFSPISHIVDCMLSTQVVNFSRSAFGIQR